MKDEIVIAQALNGQVRIHIACTTELVETARIKHDCMPTSIAALGRTLTATAIMASDLKNTYESVTSIINGHGPAGTILAQGRGDGKVRGFIGDPTLHYVREDGHLDVARAVGTNGTLTVIRNMGLKEPFTGVADLQTGEIGDDYTYYFAISEQIPSVVGVGVLVDTDYTIKAAGGLIYQLMPGASEEAIVYCEQLA
ncbi:MAG: Hsp33 family molecular chaperone HslO, partial [Solobacterium sp.]|nr:Hsp33 family molecular chaperone HslO [Solobacterium sp.]